MRMLSYMRDEKFGWDSFLQKNVYHKVLLNSLFCPLTETSSIERNIYSKEKQYTGMYNLPEQQTYRGNKYKGNDPCILNLCCPNVVLYDQCYDLTLTGHNQCISESAKLSAHYSNYSRPDYTTFQLSWIIMILRLTPEDTTTVF